MQGVLELVTAEALIAADLLIERRGLDPEKVMWLERRTLDGPTLVVAYDGKVMAEALIADGSMPAAAPVMLARQLPELVKASG